MDYHVFLSYSRKDAAIMQRVVKDMRRAGLKVWTDEGIEAGSASWQRVIEESILQSYCLVCIMTPAAKNSEWVREELNFARIQNKPVILLMALGDESTSIPFGYSRSQYVDIRSKTLYVDNMKRLLSGLLKRYGDLKSKAALTAQSDLNTVTATGLLQDVEITVVDILPEPFEWVAIPAGEVLIDGHKSSVKSFNLAKYPITCAQYDAFVEDPDGYAQPTWWDFSEDGRKWRDAHANSTVPQYYGRHLPRTEVSWYEAVAFTRWLSAQITTGVKIILPTEQQWQRAAQGDDGRDYPWGNSFSKERANTLKSDIRKPTPVDMFRNGLSPYGVLDMCGNVFEWTLSEWDSVMVDLSGNFDRVLRGSSFDASRTAAMSVRRNYAAPDAQSTSIGFRICAIESDD